jgi:hypothetical protein
MSGYDGGYGRGPSDRGPAPEGSDASERRPLVERIGLAAIAAVLAALFAFVAVASWVSGEAFLAFMGMLGVGMTGWVGLRTLFRG